MAPGPNLRKVEIGGRIEAAWLMAPERVRKVSMTARADSAPRGASSGNADYAARMRLLEEELVGTAHPPGAVGPPPPTLDPIREKNRNRKVRAEIMWTAALPLASWLLRLWPALLAYPYR
ncbi:MAG: hypothetical protein NVS9B1_24040 [Candidatus Dormibacteraceae bacterium]